MRTQSLVNSCQYDIVCFSSAYWDEPLWTNKQHVMSRISHHHCVLYVEPGLSITGCLRGWKSLKHPWKRLFPWIHKEAPNLYRYYLPVLPGDHLPVIKQINQWLQLWALRWMCRYLNFYQPLLWFYDPQAAYVLDKLSAALVCYDCVDEMTEFPVYASPKLKAHIIAAEQMLLAKADVVFTTSPHLYAAKKQANPQTYYVPNVADINHFGQARLASTPIPDDLQNIPHPIIGFIGAISAYKLDLALLQRLAASHPAWQIVLIGPIATGELETGPIQQLRHHPNIHLPGLKPYSALPGYLKGFDLCMIPYQLTFYTCGVFPMKFFEFLATGKPIVATALPSLSEFERIVKIAHSHEEFIAAVEQVLRDDPDHDREARLQAAEGHTWEARINQMMELIAERLRAKQGVSHP